MAYKIGEKGKMLQQFSTEHMHLKILFARGTHTFSGPSLLTHLPLVPHISSMNQVTIGSDNGLLPIRHQAII